MNENFKEIGVVESIYCYPVKSMRGVSVPQSKLGWHGLEGDRRYAYVKTDNKTGFPWLTARDAPKLILYSPYFDQPENVRDSSVFVTTPDDRRFAIESDDMVVEINKLSNHKVHLMHLWSGIFDAMDISLITTGSILSISSELGIALEDRQFRPNIVVRSFETRSYPEDKWLNNTLIFGDRNNPARINIHRKDLRCMVVNLDTNSGEQNATILKGIVGKRKNLLGVYGTTQWPNTIEVGDRVYLCD